MNTGKTKFLLQSFISTYVSHFGLFGQRLFYNIVLIEFNMFHITAHAYIHSYLFLCISVNHRISSPRARLTGLGRGHQTVTDHRSV